MIFGGPALRGLGSVHLSLAAFIWLLFQAISALGDKAQTSPDDSEFGGWGHVKFF
jgi:hypothetical protein